MTTPARRWTDLVRKAARLGHPMFVLVGQITAVAFALLLALLASGVIEPFLPPELLVGIVASAGLYVGLLVLGEVRPREQEPAVRVLRDQPEWQHERFKQDLDRWKPHHVRILACTTGKLNPVIMSLVASEHTQKIELLLADPSTLTHHEALRRVGADTGVAMRHISEAWDLRKQLAAAGQAPSLELSIRYSKGIVSERGILFESRGRKWLVASHYCVHSDHLHGSTNPVLIADEGTPEGRILVRHFRQVFKAAWDPPEAGKDKRPFIGPPMT